jgi:PST family polysaccharide transporter
LNSVSIATFSRLTDDPEKLRLSYLKVLSILAFVGMPLSACLTITSQDVILLLLGPQWAPAGKIFFAFGLSVGITIIYITHGWLHLSLGTPDRWFRWGIVEFTVTLLCLAAGVPFGAFGVALAFSISSYILIGPALWYAGKPIHLKISSVISKLWKYYISALLAGIASWMVLHNNDFTASIFLNFNVIVRILVAMSFCMTLYLVLIMALFQGIMPVTQLISLFREIMAKDVKNQ